MQFEARVGQVLVTNNGNLVGYFTIQECTEFIKQLKEEIHKANKLRLEAFKEELTKKLIEVDELKTLISTLESL